MPAVVPARDVPPQEPVSAARPRVCYVMSTTFTARAFLQDQLRALAERYEVQVVANETDPGALREMGIGVPVECIAIERKPSPGRDLRAVLALHRFLRRGRFDLVHSFTPKAGLLTAIAGIGTGIPRRLHTFTGQVWATRQGLARFLLKLLDRWIAFRAHWILVDSASQRDFLVRERIAARGKMHVLGAGSISGVDTSRFAPDADQRTTVRTELEISADSTLILFLGRLDPDKGVMDLARAFALTGAKEKDAHLLFVGPDEAGLEAKIRAACKAVAERLSFVGFTTRPEDYMAAADIFCLPSYREGFGTVVIEAAATGIPAIASRIYGVTDAVVDGETGILFEPGEVGEIARAMELLVREPARRRRMGDAARTRACELFSTERLTSEVLKFYAETAGLVPAANPATVVTGN